MNTRIVTDSTCDLPLEIIQRYSIGIVPNYINIGSSSYLDGLEMSHESFYRQMANFPVHPKTSAPGVGLFERAYRQMVSEGATHIISMHIHSGLSNLSNAARIAARSIQQARVIVLEVGQLAMGLGFLAVTAAEAAMTGKTVESIVETVMDQDKRTMLFAALDTLEFLRESGRAPALLVGIANLLNIKPIIQLQQGALKMAGRARTPQRCIEWLVRAAQSVGDLERLAVLHTCALDMADKLHDQFQLLIPAIGEIQIAEATPTLGVHVGPRAVGFVCVKSRES